MKKLTADQSKKNSSDYNPLFYDRNVIQVMILASSLIVFSMLLIGFLSYYFTEKEVIKKLKEKELLFIAQSISSKVEEQIDRAIETSTLLADDPSMMEWVQGREQNDKLTQNAKDKLRMIVNPSGYDNSFVVSSLTNHYWGEKGTILETMSKDKKDNDWFFQRLANSEKVVVVVDYNGARQQSFVFVNVLMGDLNHPVGVAGVGLSLKGLSDDMAAYKYSSNSQMWMVDSAGIVHLSDDYTHTGHNLKEIVSGELQHQVMDNFKQGLQVMESHTPSGDKVDVISYPIQSMNMRLLFQIPRNDTVYYLRNIKLNTAVAIVISILSIIFFFFYVSRKLANPYQRALRLNQELEFQVGERTKELATINSELLDSIGYAQRIQKSVMPDSEELAQLLPNHFVIWRPRDEVGGDFYWLKKAERGYFLAVGDCTGHGVPGAFMTMLCISHLNQIVDSGSLEGNPAEILSRLNRQIKETLRQQHQDEWADDGLDLALCYVEGSELVFAGGRSSIFVTDVNKDLQIYNGDRRSLGYRRTPTDYLYKNQHIQIDEHTRVYMATDGIFDQNGGDKGLSFGKSRLKHFIIAHANTPLIEQEVLFRKQLAEFQGNESQRDDMLLLAFQPVKADGRT
ncbi:SpoIIE family protein phosphatase [Paenibacillus sp. N3.4]|uniref:SpoIIE family protein phosphatase n=1 Tax=Paenibacillus sp. N3.4 TaxID=2603222 RepID=UPI0011C77D8B|nr:SpoIIE family protein phosphatase [Paenibacillus sp. N3.4]TXK80040.1 SpoIIE family protein phosphatase [Paenibacillus sp. N3.4]